MASEGKSDSDGCKCSYGVEDVECKTLHNEDTEYKKTPGDEEEERMLHHLRHISKNVIQDGEWGYKAQDYAVCKVNITDVCLEGIDLEQFSCYFSTMFDGTVKIGEADTDLDRLLELCVQGMFPKEISQFAIQLPTIPICQSKYEIKPGIKGTVKCTVELQEIYNEKLFFDWSKEMKLNVAIQYKQKGIELFHGGRIVDAFLRFSKAFKIIVTVGPTEMLSVKIPENNDVLVLRANLLNNMASCQLHEKNYEYVILLCQKVLQIDANNVKALYRLAVASKELQNYEVAEESLKTLLKIEPNNTAAKERLQDVKQLTKEMNERYAMLVRNMFKKAI